MGESSVHQHARLPLSDRRHRPQRGHGHLGASVRTRHARPTFLECERALRTHMPEAVPPFEDVRDQVHLAVLRERAASEAKARAEALLARIEDGDGLVMGAGGRPV